MINPMDYTGLVNGPGKFEGEARATEYYYELIMIGDGDDISQITEDGTDYLYPLMTQFEVDSEEADAFGVDAGLKDGDLAVIIEDEQGFISMVAFGSQAALDAWFTKYM
jgi:hypothetical protein